MPWAKTKPGKYASDACVSRFSGTELVDPTARCLILIPHTPVGNKTCRYLNTKIVLYILDYSSICFTIYRYWPKDSVELVRHRSHRSRGPRIAASCCSQTVIANYLAPSQTGEPNRGHANSDKWPKYHCQYKLPQRRVDYGDFLMKK